MIVVGGGAVQITNQERLYQHMQQDDAQVNKTQNQEMLYKLM
mgnify:CR=1 FL=1